MNKILKFRAWDTATKTMIETGFHLFGEVTCFDLISQQLNPLGKGSLERMNDVVITQFTGMIDKTGKEIYEGDIVKTYVYDGWFDVAEAKTCNYEIKWSNFDYGWRGFTEFMTEKFAGVTFNLTETEVIGNIFENKELL